MRQIEIVGHNIIITPKIEENNKLKLINNLFNVYLVSNDLSKTIVCLLSNPVTHKDEIQKTRNLIPYLINI